MEPSTRRDILRFGAAAFSGIVAGCTSPSEPAQSGTDTNPSASVTPTKTAEPVTFPEGPKERPDHPRTLTRASVRTYVYEMEYRYVFNSLWHGTHTDVELSCEVERVRKGDDRYEAIVACTGYADVSPPENSTATQGPHYDYFTQVFRYVVSEHTTLRTFREEW